MKYYRTGPYSEKYVVDSVIGFLQNDQDLANRKLKVTRKASRRYFYTDISATDKNGNAWHIEAKGKSSAPRGDVLEGLGQLLNIIDYSPNGQPKGEYYLALPDLKQWRYQADRISLQVRKKLSLGFLFVDGQGKIIRLTPGKPVKQVGM